MSQGRLQDPILLFWLQPGVTTVTIRFVDGVCFKRARNPGLPRMKTMTTYRSAAAIFALCTLFSGPALAQVTDPEATCADYLKSIAATGGTPKTGDAAMDKMAAEVDGKMKVYCTANPKVKAMDAAMKVMGG